MTLLIYLARGRKNIKEVDNFKAPFANPFHEQHQ